MVQTEAGAVLSIHHPQGMGKTPASCLGLIKKKNLAHMVSLIVFERCGGGKKNLAHESDSVRTEWRWEKKKTEQKKTSQERRVGCA